MASKQDFSLKGVFADLAKDTSWPWSVHHELGTLACKYINNFRGRPIIKNVRDDHGDFIAQAPLTMARLALMVVEDDFKHHGYDLLNVVLSQRNINPDDFANVKKRVEGAGD